MKKTIKKSKVFVILLVGIFFSCSNGEESVLNEQHFRKISTIDKIANDLNADIKIDENVNEDNAIIIKTEEEYREFILNVRRQLLENDNLILEPVNENGNQTNGCADGVYGASANVSVFTTLRFDVAVSNGCISGINGYFTGFTFGVSYTQGGTSFGCNSGTVCGSINYNLFFEGLGTVFSERVCYRISLNC
jgi:hypothetical protein